MAEGDVNTIRDLGFCSCLHIAFHEDIDALVKKMILSMLTRPSTFWKPGEFWGKKEVESKEQFQISFDSEVSNFEKYYAGIQSRCIGTIIIEEPSVLDKINNSSKIVVAFKKMHYGYEIMFFSSGKVNERSLADCIKQFNILEGEIKQVIISLFEVAPSDFLNNIHGPPTLFYFVNNQHEIALLEKEFENSDSDCSAFLQKYICAQGVEYKKLPRSVVDDQYIFIRHPSYHFCQELSEKYLILPLYQENNLENLIRRIDVLSSIEYFYTSFLNYTKLAYVEIEEIERRTQPIFSLLEKSRLPSLSSKETTPVLAKITNWSQELYGAYHGVDKVHELADHMFNDAMYMVNGIILPSAYGQMNEIRLTKNIEGVAESIGKELQMRLHHIKNVIGRSVGRSYTTVSSISNLIRAHSEHLLNKTMVDYTRHIKYLTILIAVLTIVMIFSDSIFSIIKSTIAILK